MWEFKPEEQDCDRCLMILTAIKDSENGYLGELRRHGMLTIQWQKCGQLSPEFP
jgi:hypothetical protein